MFEILSDDQTCLDDGGFYAHKEMDIQFYNWVESIQDSKRYAIILKKENKCIGLIHLQNEDRAIEALELGFVLNKNYRRNGYMSEALSGMISKWFENTTVQMFTASHFPYNTASKQLIQKLGFTYEGIRRKAMHHAVYGPIDLLCYYKERDT